MLRSSFSIQENSRLSYKPVMYLRNRKKKGERKKSCYRCYFSPEEKKGQREAVIKDGNNENWPPAEVDVYTTMQHLPQNLRNIGGNCSVCVGIMYEIPKFCPEQFTKNVRMLSDIYAVGSFRTWKSQIVALTNSFIKGH